MMRVSLESLVKNHRKETTQGKKQDTSLHAALQLKAELSKQHQAQDGTKSDTSLETVSKKHSPTTTAYKTHVLTPEENPKPNALSDDKQVENETTSSPPKFTPEQLKRRAVAAKQRAEILQEVSNDSMPPTDLGTREAYRAARGGPIEVEADPSLEQKEQLKRHTSVKFSSPTGIELKDNQTRPFIHSFDLQIEAKASNSEEDCQKLLQKQLHLFFSMVLLVQAMKL